MSGHSKFANIKHKKARNDAAKGKIFTKLGREIAVAIKTGGSSDPEMNRKLKDVIAKAKANNMPNDTIERSIKKAARDADNINYERIIYEGYGPKGVAVMVETLTDNKNRTVSNIRSAFTKAGGGIGAAGCVSFMFKDVGQIIIEQADMSEDDIMELSIDLGAADYRLDDDGLVKIFINPQEFSSVLDIIAQRKLRVESAELTKVPGTFVNLDNEEDIKKIVKLFEALEDNDDVQNIYHNEGYLSS